MGRLRKSSLRIATVALVCGMTGIGCAAMVLSPSAGADPDQENVKFFVSPSGNISCELDFQRAGLPDTAYCVSSQPQQSVSMTPEGVLDVCGGESCMSDPPLEATTLRYGQTTGIGPFTCRSEEIGVTCRVASGRGFTISTSGIAPVG